MWGGVEPNPAHRKAQHTNKLAKREKRWRSLKVPVVVFAVGLQDDGGDGHDGFEHAELQRRLVGRNTSHFRRQTSRRRKDT